MFSRIYRKVKQNLHEALAWIDSHPRTGWYVAFMVTLNVVLTLFNLVH